MLRRHSIWAAVQGLALLSTVVAAQAHDPSKYPDLRGQWDRMAYPGTGAPSFDQSKGQGLRQQAPLTPEYQKILDDSVADQLAGGQGNNTEHARCVAAGMPWMMIAFRPLEFVVLPDVTYILIADYDALRRVFTDGRDFPNYEATFSGFSIGKWIDEDGDGKYDVLEVETRNFKGPRLYDPSGLALHRDNQSVIKERIYLDKRDPNLLHDETTVIDNALTRPWTVDKKYIRNADPLAEWPESVCTEVNNSVFIGKEYYFMSADGYLMPAKKGQKPPDTRYFEKASN
jgi:hypothetical protein